MVFVRGRCGCCGSSKVGKGKRDRAPFRSSGNNRGRRTPRNGGPRGGVPGTITIAKFTLLFKIISDNAFLTSGIIKDGILKLANIAGAGAATAGTIDDGTSLSGSSDIMASSISDVIRGMVPSVMSVAGVDIRRIRSFFNNISRRRDRDTKAKVVVSRGSSRLLIIAGGRMMTKDSALAIAFTSKADIRTGVGKAGSRCSVTIITIPLSSVSSSAVGTVSMTALKSSARLGIKRPTVTVNGTLNCKRSMAANMVDTLGHSISRAGRRANRAARDSTGLVRASTTVGPKGDNKTLMGTDNRIVKVGSSGLINSSMRNIKCTVPVDSMSSLVRGLVGRTAGAGITRGSRNTVNVGKVDIPTRCSGRLGVPRNICMSRVAGNNKTRTTKVAGKDIVATVSKAAMSDVSSLRRRLRCCTGKSGISLAVRVPRDGKRCRRGAIRMALNTGWGCFWIGMLYLKVIA